MNTNLLGFITGILFGVLLQRAQVVRYDRQLGALLFKDMTIVKFMLSAVLVGMVGVYFLIDAGIAKLSIKPMVTGAVIFGGFIFGAGWALLGYCPGTSVAALGEGRWDSIFGILGMIVGAGIFAEMYPWVKRVLLTWGDFGKITLPQVIGINHWVIIITLWAASLLLFRWFEKRHL